MNLRRLRAPARVLAFTLCFGVLAPATRSAAAPPHLDENTEHARAIFTHAEALYTLQKWSEALVEYEHAFELAPLPGFLFNIAQCHRQLGHPDQAMHFYKLFLEREPKAANRDIVLNLIDEMEQKQASMPGPPPPPRPAPRVVPTTPKPVVALTPAPDAVVPPQPAPPPVADTTPAYRKWWPWTILGVVVVGAGVGAGIALAPPPEPGTTLGTIDASH